ALAAYQGKKALVLAIPRGAVPMGRVLADHAGRIAIVVDDGLATGAYTDEAVCLDTPEPSRAISLFYRSFPQVEDSEVKALLQKEVSL
ncbi:MAG: hypothetical protein ACREI7_09260, partial [Myxococcota bacterium]